MAPFLYLLLAYGAFEMMRMLWHSATVPDFSHAIYLGIMLVTLGAVGVGLVVAALWRSALVCVLALFCLAWVVADGLHPQQPQQPQPQHVAQRHR